MVPTRPGQNARASTQLSDDFPVTRSGNPLVSVVVPTRDRPAALARCLDALDAQTLADRLEVLVVDDGSRAAAEVSSVVGRHSRARLIQRLGAGPAAARNAGARAARGSFLCFTDDDCAPCQDWVEQLVETLRHGADAAAGTTIARGGALAEASEIVAHAPASATARDGGLSFAPSNNLACTKAIFDSTPFDESYPHAAGEDREWCARLIASGHTLRSAPAARLVHHQDLTPRRFLRQQLRYGEGAFRFRRQPEARRPLESPAFYTALVRRAFARSFSVGLLVCVAQAATAVGFIRGWLTQRTPASRSRSRSEP